jgi:hypothetical protein
LDLREVLPGILGHAASWFGELLGGSARQL